MYHGNISVEKNHKLIEDTLKLVCDKLNEAEVDYYVVGALSAFISTKTPLFRYHSDIDFLVAEKDIEKIRETLGNTDYEFQDNRLNNKKSVSESFAHTRGEHEVIANHKKNEFHLGFFLFQREQDDSMTIREYFMSEQKVPMIVERNYPKELVNLEYTKDEVKFAGTKFRVSTPESVYAKKTYTKNAKDLLDIQALKDKIDIAKVEEAKKYRTSTRIVEALPRAYKTVAKEVLER